MYKFKTENMEKLKKNNKAIILMAKQIYEHGDDPCQVCVFKKECNEKLAEDDNYEMDKEVCYKGIATFFKKNY